MSKRVRSTDFGPHPARKRRGGAEPGGWRALLALRRGDLRRLVRRPQFALPMLSVVVLILLAQLNTYYHQQRVLALLNQEGEAQARQADAFLIELSNRVDSTAIRIADGSSEPAQALLPLAQQVRVLPYTELGIADRDNQPLESLRHIERDLLRRVVEQQQVLLDVFSGASGLELNAARPIDAERVLLVTFPASALRQALSEDLASVKTELLYRTPDGWKPLISRGQADASPVQVEAPLRNAWQIRLTMDKARYQAETHRNLPLYSVALIALLAALVQLLRGTLNLRQQRRSEKRSAAEVDAHQDSLINAAFTHDDESADNTLDDGLSDSLDDLLDDLDLPEPSEDGAAQNPESGSSSTSVADTIFRAYDIRGIAERELTTDVCREIGKALGSELVEQKQRVTLIARDGRNSSPRIRDALVEGLRWCGVSVIDLGAVPTPVMQFATRELGIGNGFMVTGSHNGREYNGIKMVIRDASLTEDAIFSLRERIRAQRFIEAAVPGDYSNRSIVDEYIARIRTDVVVARRLKVVVDAANGVTGPVAPRLFQALGCAVEPLFCELDGDFPNHDPDPTRPGNLHALQATVKTRRADLGIALDGDGDRVVFVTAQGETVYPDQALMLLAQDVIARNPGAPIVFDVKCSSHLPRLITDAGGLPIMCRSGHSYVKNQIKESGALLGGEFTGHIFFRERWYGFDDGMYVAARLLEFLSLSSMRLHEHLERLPQSVVTHEITVPSDEVQKFVIIEQLKSDNFFDGAEVNTLDGLRVEYPHGWGLVRASNTGPALSLRFEADTEAHLANIQARFRDALQAVDPTLKNDF
ncbi:phosphomannomutase/phosphoglucomutase [Litorivivens sp.]|uniref:phosphomannomutase/phosphoglucomutase n=1 Tax=Litorivivens sp. TaxID=2020868 RepID=UPI003563ED66